MDADCLETKTRKVRIHSLHLFRSYGSIMLGSTEVVNEWILGNLERSYVPEYLKRYPFVALSVEKYRQTISNELPDVACVAFLKSDYSMSGDPGMESGLVAFWFQHDFLSHPGREIEDSIRMIDWEKLAGDCGED